MPLVTLIDLDKDNWQRVAALKVAPGQEDFVADNLTTIAESQFYPWTHRKVILADGAYAGFAVFGTMPDDDQMWLHRFMIDARFQRQGIGREALRLLIEIWQSMTELKTVKLSYTPSNKVAEDLYSSVGFVPGEIAEWGERVATLELNDR